ncbi:MAG TPA: HAD-IA family hydrolase [Vicinamibacterales bacterium]|jgi:2-haloacid dehalogenase
MSDRWATFDCYGTLIDWNGGIRSVMARVFGEPEADQKLKQYHQIEPRLEHDGRRTYREILTMAMRELGAPASEVPTLAASLPSWPPFPEVPEALRSLRASGWRLAILSNTDRDYIEASLAAIGVPVDLTIVASEIGSYKPAANHWEAFFRRTGADPRAHVHVAASLYHDIAPAAALKLRAIWINRLAETSALPRAAELMDLSQLPSLLDALARDSPGNRRRATGEV